MDREELVGLRKELVELKARVYEVCSLNKKHEENQKLLLELLINSIESLIPPNYILRHWAMTAQGMVQNIKKIIYEYKHENEG